MTEQRRNTRIGTIPGVNVGDPIRAKWLTDVARGVNAAAEALAAPQSTRPLSGDGQSYELDASGNVIKQPDGQLGGTVWTETARDTSTVRIFDSGGSGNYVDIQRIDAITFAAGSRTMTLFFRNS